mgnify:CR=1 FL=1|jgi:hypothetical protein|tara:strand:- start:646 stop:879 length:234 start_codon:yes stop_codon:yes gene_type:complete
MEPLSHLVVYIKRRICDDASTWIMERVDRITDAVGLDRLFSFGLGAFGQAGVSRVLEILEEEITQAMMLLWTRQLAI